MNICTEIKSFDEEWEQIHSTQDWGSYPSEFVIRFVARNFYNCPDRSKVKILDFGCGGGAHTWYLAREGFDTYAFDGSQSAITKLSRRLSQERLSADLRVLDGCQLDYNPNTFDAVIDSVCIYATTIDNIKYMYSEIYDILKDGGKLFTSMFSVRTTGYSTGTCIERNTFKDVTIGRLAGRGTTHFFEESEIKEILSELHFQDIVIEKCEYDDLGDIVSMLIVKATK